MRIHLRRVLPIAVSLVFGLVDLIFFKTAVPFFVAHNQPLYKWLDVSFTTWASDRLARKLLPKLLALTTMLPVLMWATYYYEDSPHGSAIGGSCITNEMA